MSQMCSQTQWWLEAPLLQVISQTPSVLILICLQSWLALARSPPKKTTNYADGVAFVSQCPIAPNHSFQYDFRVPDRWDILVPFTFVCTGTMCLPSPIRIFLFSNCSLLSTAMNLEDQWWSTMMTLSYKRMFHGSNSWFSFKEPPSWIHVWCRWW